VNFEGKERFAIHLKTIMDAAFHPGFLQARNQRSTHLHPRPQQPDLDIHLTNAKDFRGIKGAELTHMAEYQNRTVFRWKRFQTLRDRLAKLLSFQDVKRRLAPLDKIATPVVSIVREPSFQGFVKVTFVPAYFDSRFIDADLDKPRTEPGLTTELKKIPKGFQDTFLDHFLGIGFIAENRQGPHKNAALVRANQFTERLDISD